MTARHPFRPEKQRGVALPVALMVLVAMILAAVTLMRNIDTSTMVATNLTYKQHASHAADAGIQAAYQWLENTMAAAPASLYNTNTGMGYISSRRPDDAYWNPATAWDDSIARQVAIADPAVEEISYVIHRLCANPNQAAGPGSGNICATITTRTGAASVGASQSAGAFGYNYSSLIYYRITVRVVSKRNAVSYVQALVVAPSS